MPSRYVAVYIFSLQIPCTHNFNSSFSLISFNYSSAGFLFPLTGLGSASREAEKRRALVIYFLLLLHVSLVSEKKKEVLPRFIQNQLVRIYR